MFCSTIIPTVGRDALARAVKSVLEQSLAVDAHEVIVVNDSGRPLSPAAWQQDARVQVLHTQRRERSFARNTGAAVARGRYLHFLDDDDWLVPGALQHLQALSQASDAGWLYGSSQLVNQQLEPTIQLHHGINGNVFLQVMAGEWIPLQVSLIRSETFWAVGGFNQLIAGPEDIDLLRRVALHESVVGSDVVVAHIIRGQADTTTDYHGHSEISRWARERILDMPGVFRRMRATADSAYWRGRVVRIYLTSGWWNTRRRRGYTAVSRVLHAMLALLAAAGDVWRPKLWKAISSAYNSDTFRRGFEAERDQKGA